MLVSIVFKRYFYILFRLIHEFANLFVIIITVAVA